MPWKNVNRFLGLMTLESSKRIGKGYLATAKNMDCSTLGYLTPSKGYSLFGIRVSTSGKITSSFTYRLGDASEVLLRVHDNETNAVLEWYNSQADAWEHLQNFTTGEVLQFFPFNLTTNNQLYLSNGTDNWSEWNGATTYLTQDESAGATTINVADTTNFDATGSLVIDGTTVTYTGKTSTTFTGCGSMPEASKNEGVAQLVDTTTHAALPELKIGHVAMGRVWGVESTDPNLLQVSKLADAEDWTVGTNADDPFAKDFPEGLGEITAISSIDKYILVFKKDIVMAIWLEVTSDASATSRILNIRTIRRGDNEGAISSSVIQRLNSVYYIPPKGGIRGITINPDGEFVADDLCDIISPTIKDGVFDSESQLVWWEKEKKILMSYKKDSDSTVCDTQVLVDLVRQADGSVVKALSTKNWPCNCFFIYSDDLYFGDSYTPNCYKAFDGFDLDEGPQESIATLGAYDFGLVEQEKAIYYLAISGKIASGHRIRFQADYDDDGSRVHLEADFDYNNELDREFIVEPQLNTIGSFELGTEPLGGTIEDIDELNSFFFFFQMPAAHKFYNLQITCWGDGLDSNDNIVGNRWLIDNIGYLVEDAGYEIDSHRVKNFSES